MSRSLFQENVVSEWHKKDFRLSFSRALQCESVSLEVFISKVEQLYINGVNTFHDWFITLLSVGFICRMFAFAGARWGVHVYATLCVRPLHSHRPLGRTRRQSQHHLRQVGLLSRHHLPDQTILWWQVAQVSPRQRRVFRSLGYKFEHLFQSNVTLIILIQGDGGGEAQQHQHGGLPCAGWVEWCVGVQLH